MIVYIKKSASSPFEKITIPDSPFSEGGQGKVYRILTPGYEDFCIKYYKPEYRDTNYARISYMISNPPNQTIGSGAFRICWPVALAYDANKKFVGYMMPLAFPDSRDLLILSTYNAKPISQQARYKKYTSWFNKFELDTETGVRNRMKMLCNWIIAIQSIHRTGKYVIIDLKPENVMATGSGKISIIDTDSFQISENGRILFSGPMFTPEYFPPEAAILHEKNLPITVACDRFAAAVCFYKILTGVHPYAGTIKKYPYDKIEQIQEAIKENLFAFGSKSAYLSFNNDFNLHKHFGNLTPPIQNLFKRAFGDNPSNRPGMEEWDKAFRAAITAKDGVKGNRVKPNKPSPTIKVVTSLFADTDYDGNIIRDFGYNLFTDVSYLTPKLYYQFLKDGRQEVRIWVKIISPSGRLEEGPHRAGFTTYGDRTLVPDHPDSQHIYAVQLGGWGNNNKTAYSQPGDWTVEFYEGTFLLHKTIVKIRSNNVVPAAAPPAPSYRPAARSSSSDDMSWRGCLVCLLITALLVGGGLWIHNLYSNHGTVKKYVIAQDAAFRKKDNNKLIRYIPYGEEVREYDVLGTVGPEKDFTSEIKHDGKKGYIPSDYLLDKADFDLLNGVWANEKTIANIYPTKCKLAILDFLKVNQLSTDKGGWRLDAGGFDKVPNNVMLCELTDGFDRYSEFAFILQNETTGERKTAIYSFDNSGNPVLRHTETAPSTGGLVSISFNKKGKTYNIIYGTSPQKAGGNRNPGNYPTDKDVKKPSGYKFEVRGVKEIKSKQGYVTSDKKIYPKTAKYLAPSIVYEKPTLGKEKLTLGIKVIGPDGNLMRDSKSPYGYTFMMPCVLNLKGDYITLMGWRPDNNARWLSGDYKMEVWFEGEKHSEAMFSIE